MNFDNAFEKDSRVAIRIQTPMPDFDNKVGGLNPAGMDVGGINDCEPGIGQALASDIVQHIESILSRGLIPFIVGDKAPAKVRIDYFSRQEMAAGKR